LHGEEVVVIFPFGPLPERHVIVVGVGTKLKHLFHSPSSCLLLQWVPNLCHQTISETSSSPWKLFSSIATVRILLTYFSIPSIQSFHLSLFACIRCHLEGRWTHPRRSGNSRNASLQGQEARLRHQQFLEVALSVRSKVPILRNFRFAGSLLFSFFQLTISTSMFAESFL